MAHDEALAALKLQVATLISAVDTHLTDVRSALAAMPVSVDNSSEFELMRAQLAEATAKLAEATAPKV
jgi:hypothetical protein